ncbi:hypothetical protein M0R45_019590 [Rubus argutus]|uniref:Aminotransferase-like plant mobile domain-containing protein n=1 Tax=Rubus argutus TaxID=59490 RepID=A0AAW1X7F8_RUBAR
MKKKKEKKKKKRKEEEVESEEEPQQPAAKKKKRKNEHENKDDEEDIEEVDQKTTRHRISFTPFIEFLKKFTTNEEFSPQLSAILSNTPFWPLIKACIDGKINEDEHTRSDYALNLLLRHYDDNTHEFHIGETRARITDMDVTDILGLPNAGEDVEIEKSAARHSDEALIKTYFAKCKRIKKGVVDEAADAVLKNRKWNDVAGMIVAQLMILILFPNTTQAISWKLFSYCDDVDKLGKYAWAKVVNGKLKMSLVGRPKHPGGCLLLVLFWYREKSNIVKPTEGKESEMPSLIKWNMRELHKALRASNEDLRLCS